jgi:hypothetical protein
MVKWRQRDPAASLTAAVMSLDPDLVLLRTDGGRVATAVGRNVASGSG